MRKTISGAVLLLLIMVLSLLLMGDAPVDASSRLSPPSLSAPMGTDTFGRDLAERMGTGMIVSLSIAASVTAISLASGILLSFLFSVWGLPNPLLLTVIITLKTIPPVLLALFLNALTGPGVLKLVAVLSFGNMANIAETAYSKVMVLRSEDYVLASIGLGKGRIYAFFRHMLPAVLPYLAIQSISIFSASILSEASLSFLGCGVPVTIPTLGAILSESRQVFMTAPWMVAFPALFLFLTGLSLECILAGLSEPDPSSHGSCKGKLVRVSKVASDGKP